MKVIARDLWLCADCMIAAVNDDYTGLDYYLSAKQADERMHEIQRGLASLGPHLVPDFGGEPVLECSDCDHMTPLHRAQAAYNPDVEYDTLVCEGCGSFEVSERESGEDEFSRYECDCCGTSLAGARFRFAILGEEEVVA